MKNIQIFSRRTDRAILMVFGLILLAAAPMLIVDSSKARKARQEHERMTALKQIVVEKVEAYQKINGRYPDSLAALSFTNSPRELDMVS
ncbi:MAG TPA: hypothetical protein VLT36_21460, partial [Candidatus Dormibacteraeota bacterium]|nr:hypothetical protein [Candidatus Dormibacteraeota bacterium]